MPVFNRQEMYDLVWTEPMRTIAQRFKLSDVGLSKICRKASVPVPPRGHWAKLAAGKKVERIPLPRRSPGQRDRIDLGPQAPFRWPPDPVAELAEPMPKPPVFEDPIEAVVERVEKQVSRVPARPLAAPHPVIGRFLQKDEQRREKRRTSAWPSL